MQNIESSFNGQQTDERILYVVRPHDIALYLQLAKIYSLALAVLVSFFLLSNLLPFLPTLGFIFAVVIAGLGTVVSFTMFSKNIAYLTDRRVVRFEPATPFATNIRSLNWDDAVKIKSFPPNFLYKMFKVGTVIIHARSTFVHTHDQIRENVMSNDDIDLTNVFYYRDLGNYIDKILYAYKHQPEEVQNIRPFVPAPKGQRY